MVDQIFKCASVHMNILCKIFRFLFLFSSIINLLNVRTFFGLHKNTLSGVVCFLHRIVHFCCTLSPESSLYLL